MLYLSLLRFENTGCYFMLPKTRIFSGKFHSRKKIKSKNKTGEMLSQFYYKRLSKFHKRQLQKQEKFPDHKFDISFQ